jgi:hypothetical protein
MSTTISIVAALLTGLGYVTANQANFNAVARVLAVGAVVLAFSAVLLSLVAQSLGIIRGLNRQNLAEIEEWYRNRIENRALRLRWATLLLVAAAALAGTAAVLTLVGESDAPTLAVTRTSIAASGKLTVDVTFRGLDPGEVASAVVRVDGSTAAEAGFGPGTDGTATRTLTVEQIPTSGIVTVEAHGGDNTCTARLEPGGAAEVRCLGG